MTALLTAQDGLASAGVALALVVLFQIARIGLRAGWRPELARKAVHVGMGLVAIGFPWMFSGPLPVWILAAASFTAFALLRLNIVRLAAPAHAAVLHGVDRKSWGEFCMPLAIAILFTLSQGDPILFVVPMMILTLADSASALAGQRYGQARFETDDGVKSFEGSAMFFLVAFLSTHVPVLLFTECPRLESVLIGLVMGVILVLTEAISWRGLDNLFLPLAAYACLERFLTLGSGELLMRLAVLMLLLVALRAWSRWTHLTPSAAIAAALFLYVIWASAPWHWLVAPVATLLGYTLLCPNHSVGQRTHTVEAVASIGGLGLAWLVAATALGTVNTIYAYGIGFGAHLSMIAVAFFSASRHRLPLPWVTALAWLIGFGCIAIPYLVV